MNDPEVVTESVVAPPLEAHANGSSSPPELAPAPDAVSSTPPVPDMQAPLITEMLAPVPSKSEPSPSIPPLPEIPAPAPPMALIVPAAQVAPAPNDSLEERLRRLEATLTALADAKRSAPIATPMPEASGRSAAGAIRDSASRVISAGRWLLPMTLAGGRGSAEEPPTYASESKSPWFLIDALNELITYKYMYGDPRYRLSWTGRVMPLVFVVLILVPWASLPMISMLPGFLAAVVEKLLVLMLAFLFFKVLSREARRYRTVIPQYPPIVPH